MGYEAHLTTISGFMRRSLDHQIRISTCFHHCYRFVEDIEGHPNTWARVPAFIIDEIRAVGLHVKIAVANLRAPVSNKLWVTDATPTSGGAVEAPIPDALARFIPSLGGQGVVS